MKFSWHLKHMFWGISETWWSGRDGSSIREKPWFTSHQKTLPIHRGRGALKKLIPSPEKVMKVKQKHSFLSFVVFLSWGCPVFKIKIFQLLIKSKNKILFCFSFFICAWFCLFVCLLVDINQFIWWNIALWCKEKCLFSRNIH
jgi:hypothetical protein